MHPLLTSSAADGQTIGVVLLVGAALGILIILAIALFSHTKKSPGKGRAAPPPAGKAKEPGKPAPGKPEAKKPVPEKGAAKQPVRLGSLAPEEQKSAAEPRREPIRERKDDTSIDKGYAAQHGMWVCGYCEVLNDNTLNICQACGQPRSR